jgi:DNA adenine methylase
MQVSYSGNACEVSLEHEKEKNIPILLKWPGGKRAILKHLLPFAPPTFRRYYEPFVGSGALFFTLSPVNANLSDANKELTNCYIQVRDHPQAIIEVLANMRNTQEDYYRIRESSPRDPVEQAARFIYLMTLSFNGLHRVNLQGKFNVPYNHKTHLNPCDQEKIFKASLALARASITNCDFEKAVERAAHGDFIYFDPPYTVSVNQRRFVKYNDVIFSWKDQIRLAGVARHLALQGCHVLVSNANHPAILELYQDHGFHAHTITRLSVIAAKSIHRGNIAECLFYRRQEDPC